MPYTRKGVVYEGPTLKRGRKAKALVVVPAAGPKPVSSNVKNYVKKAINAQGEAKLAVREIFKQIAIPGTGLDTAAGYGLGTTNGCIPLLARGTGPADRVGDDVRVKDFVLNWTIRANDITSAVGSNPLKTPFMVRIIVFNHRFAQDEASATLILDKGNTSGNLDSSPDSWLEPYNKKEFIIHYSKTYKLSPLMNNSVGTGLSATVENMPNGFNYFIKGSKRIKLPKKLLYQDTTQTPTNSMPQVVFAVCNVDGTGSLNTIYRAQVNLESKLTFYD